MSVLEIASADEHRGSQMPKPDEDNAVIEQAERDAQRRDAQRHPTADDWRKWNETRRRWSPNGTDEMERG